MKVELFNICVDNLDISETITEIEKFINSQQPHQHAVVNVNKIIKTKRDSELKDIINKCDLVNADGMPLVWASKFLGKPLKQRVAGIDLFFALIEEAAKKNWKIYLLGASPQVVTKCASILRDKYPSLSLAGFRDGYWQPEEEAEIVEDIKISRPDILFVGISSPQKERFLGRNLQALGTPFVMGVGGSFDVLAGKVKRAPLWMQECGLEWLWRFIHEPQRLFKRYFVEGPAFIRILFQEMMTDD